jgi:transcription initiation factor IIF auxiliary subunit
MSRHVETNTLAKIAIKTPPFRIQEEGWGEFDMQIGLYADKEHSINHDLNFQQSRYESKHTIVR